MSTGSTTPGIAAPWLRLFLPFAVGYYLSYLLRNVNAVIAPVLTRELELSAADLGLLTSAYFFAFGLFQIPLGILLDRYGPRRIEAALLLFAAAGALVFALGQGMTQLVVGRALIGLGVSACLMAALKHFSQWYPAERQSALTGAVMTAGGLGIITASAPLEALLPYFGWRGIFLGLTAVVLAAAAFLYFTVPDRAQGTARQSLGAQWRELAGIFASRPFWRFAPFMALFAGGLMAVQGLWAVPWFIQVEGLSRQAAAQNLLGMGVAALAGFFAIAAFATPLIRRGVTPATLLGAVLGLGWLCLVALVAGVEPALPLWMGVSFFASITTIAYPALGGYYPAALFGRASTALNLLSFVGAFSIQWGIGVLVDLFVAWNWSPAGAFRAAFGVLAILQLFAWGWYAREGRREGARQAHARPAPPVS